MDIFAYFRGELSFNLLKSICLLCYFSLMKFQKKKREAIFFVKIPIFELLKLAPFIQTLIFIKYISQNEECTQMPKPSWSFKEKHFYQKIFVPCLSDINARIYVFWWLLNREAPLLRTLICGTEQWRTDGQLRRVSPSPCLEIKKLQFQFAADRDSSKIV